MNPVIKLTVKVEGENYSELDILNTSMLIYKKDCYAYCFYAKGQWRQCWDSKIKVSGSVAVDYDAGYIGTMRDTYGPGAIYNALQKLSSSSSNSWRLGFLHLAYFFLESARMPPVAVFMRQTITEAGFDRYAFVKEIDGTTSKYYRYWDKISSEILKKSSDDLGNSEDIVPVCSTMARDLGLPVQGKIDGDDSCGNIKVKVSDLLNMQCQLVCSGCTTMLLYPRGALNVRCAVCNTVTSVQPAGLEMDQIICGCCHTLLMYTRGATSVRCLCCHTVNLTSGNASPATNQFATVRCGSCQMTLMYPCGTPSVKCAVCHYITNVGILNSRVANPVHRPHEVATLVPSSSAEVRKWREKLELQLAIFGHEKLG